MYPEVPVSPGVARRMCQVISQLYKPAQMMKMMMWKPEFMEREYVGDGGRSWRRNLNPFGDARAQETAFGTLVADPAVIMVRS